MNPLLSKNLRKKLSALNRSGVIKSGRDIPVPPLAKKYGPMPVGEVAPGEVLENVFGQFLLWERPVQELVSQSQKLHAEYQAIFRPGGPSLPVKQYHSDIQSLLACDCGQVLFLDIETTGLGAGQAFLVGLMAWAGDGFLLRQLIARDYAEEPALLHYLSESAGDFNALVTFNGKSFDHRFLQERCTANGIVYRPEWTHLDLLHEGRRRWKNILPDCKLQTIEKHVTGRVRVGDIPGAEIPGAYHEFVKTGDAVLMPDILHHNALDLITVAEVLVHILNLEPRPA